ncbi:hypothetical protein [Leptospira bouyouniensis]|uniref:hypothetical protein n=1 Tax=Leptospira bouyouniensis TaxID=2484911 RepID=UPI001090D6D8|nr:hypothetical protein [Leptospira bouyouniensis]TGM74366.1 hypothetical protein EHQ99_19030 [Leptospira bouyouniensis]
MSLNIISMKSMKIYILSLLIALNFNCYGPALSEKYVCKDEQSKEDSFFTDCFFLYQLKRNQTEEDRAIVAYCAKLYDEKCKNKSSQKPWWL